MALAGEPAGQTHACLWRLPHQCPVGADCRPLHLQVRSGELRGECSGGDLAVLTHLSQKLVKSPKQDAQKVVVVVVVVWPGVIILLLEMLKVGHR